ncbi:RDD family protein [Occallatibacter savannae]|uniref:RDD family protein n=1 Tax=Occallatibacter savannae TaxID=1002691 RepID=UPI0013A59716|nr:RDD family protein [Occallatibacter savannae]
MIPTGPDTPSVLSSDQLSIETPELVAIQMPIAGIGSRFIALLVDYLIWIPGILIVGRLFAYFLPSLSAFNKLSEQWAFAIYLFLIFLFNWGYFTLFEAFWNGRTPGKRVAGIRVIERSGRPIGLFESMARNFIRYVDQIPFFYAVGAIAIFVTKDHQRLGDLAAGTLVVRDRIEEAPVSTEASRTFTANLFAPAVAAPEPHAGLSLPDHGVAKLSSADLQVLESFFARRLDMPLETREALAQRIASAIQAKSGLEPPTGASVETFLEIAARQLRDVARMQR